jgi:hydroxymethylglutaryl-CoA reductase
VSPSSRISGFYRVPREGRLQVIREFLDEASPDGSGDLGEDLTRIFETPDLDLLDSLVENAAGMFALPLGIAVNFVVDGVDRLIPMAVEESSVVAAASNMARLVRETGGFETTPLGREMIGQIQLVDVPDGAAAVAAVESRVAEVRSAADALDPLLVERGGGCSGLTCRVFSPEETGEGTVVVVHLHVDTVDAMGANTVNTMCESLAPRLADWTGATVGLRILSNLADRRRVRATCRVQTSDLATGRWTGAEVARRIVSAARFAHYDPYRAATHNKGIMNGIDSVLVATGNDWRATEAGVHAWAARDGQYRSVSNWTVEGDLLVGEIEIPIQVGTVGGVTRIHPAARLALRMLRVETAEELGRVVAAVGLAQNLGALRALATEGIQRGHMRLHRANQVLAEDMGDDG